MFGCENCGFSLQHRDGHVTPCPKCGGERWGIRKHVEHPLAVCQELGAVSSNAEGEILAERIQKTDFNTSASVTADLGKPSRISVERRRPILGFEEEGAAVEALADPYNRLRKTDYLVEEKTEENFEYADRVLTSHNYKPARINVQIRNLDDEIIAGINKLGAVDVDRTASGIVALMSGAIEDKANIDPQLKAETILLLMLPAPLGEAIRQSIDRHEFGCKGFREIWISSFHEEPFPLNAKNS